MYDLEQHAYIDLARKNNESIVGTVLFSEPVVTTAMSVPNMKQYATDRVFTTDISFAGTLLGHQGSSATYPCIYCLMKLSNRKRCFNEHQSICYTEQTIERMIDCANICETNYEQILLTAQSQSNVHKHVTAKLPTERGFGSNVSQPGLRINIVENVTPSGLHIVQGLT